MITVYYDKLVKAAQDNKPFIVGAEEEWVHVVVTDLDPDGFYVTPFLFWAQKERQIKVNIINPNDKTRLIKSWDVKLGPDRRGNNDWVKKRYKLDKERQNGQAHFTIGWSKDATINCGFSIVAAPLDSKKLRHKRRREEGRCPECGEPGYWSQLAMVCDEHGVFIG